MSERNHGKVVPFALSASRIRRSADAYRKRGQPVEAVELLRRAAIQEDSAAGWLRLAQQLRRAACYEQATVILYRLCAREDMLTETWLELARCQQALGRREAACDSVYHYLHEDPYSDAADQARDMLTDLESVDESHGAFRLSGLIRRGLTAYRRGERELGERRLRRGIRMARDKARLYVTLAMLDLAEGRCREALMSLNRALKYEPDNIRAASMRCVALSAMGKRRMARGLLSRCAAMADAPEKEDYFLTAAWTISAGGIAKRYLSERLGLHPCRIALMHPMAEILWQEGQQEAALRWWRRILALDPDDMRARSLLAWAPEHPGEPLPPMDALPSSAVQQLLETLQAMLARDETSERLLAWGSQSRRALDWCFTLPDESMQQAALHLIGRKDAPCARQYLRQLLTAPGVSPSVRQRTLLRLAELGESGPMNVLMAQRITQAQLTPVQDTRRNLWQLFLPQLLRETRRTCHAAALTYFAADLWQGMTPQQRHRAAGQESYLWVKAMEILFLRLTGHEDEAASIVRTMPVSPRKVSRILRELKRQTDMYMEGEDIP